MLRIGEDVGKLLRRVMQRQFTTLARKKLLRSCSSGRQGLKPLASCVDWEKSLTPCLMCNLLAYLLMDMSEWLYFYKRWDDSGYLMPKRRFGNASEVFE